MQGDVYKKRKSFFDLITSPISFSDFSARLDVSDSSHIEIIQSASGEVVPTSHGRLLHSRYDPKKEAARSFDALLTEKGHHLVVLQFDFLYGVEYWVSKKSAQYDQTKSKPDYHLLLAVQDWAMLDAFILNRDWSFLSFFRSVELIYLNDSKWRHWIERSFLRWCSQSFRGVIFFEGNKSHESQGNLLVADFKKYLLQMISNHFSNYLTRYVFEKKWFMNTFLNLIAQKNYHSASDLFSKSSPGEKSLAVLVSSGPSLDEQIDEIATLPMDKITLVAVDSAVPILSTRGIVPDIVVAVDGGYYNALDLGYSSPADKKPFLFSSVFAHPLLLRYASQQGYAPSCFFYLRREDSLWENFFSESKNSNQVFIFQSSSVALVAIDLIKKLNFRNVVAYGLDACYPFFHGHASASTHDRYYTQKTDRLHPREQGDFFSVVEHAKKISKEGDTQNKNLYDIPSLKRFRNELSNYFSQKENQNLKLFIRSPYFPFKLISSEPSIFFSKDSNEVLSMAKFSKKLEMAHLAERENAGKKSKINDEHWVDFFKMVNLFKEKLDQYSSVSQEEKYQLAAKIDAFIENKFVFLRAVVEHYRQLLSVRDDLQDDVLSKKEMIYYEVLVLFSRMERYSSSMLR